MKAAQLELLPISDDEAKAYKNAGIQDVGQLLQKSEKELNALFNRVSSEERIAYITSAAHAIQAPNAVSALDLLEKEQNRTQDDRAYPTEQWRSTGDKHIDQLLGGGLREGALTEISGRFATGKTQIILQSAIFTALALTTAIHATETTPAQEEREDSLLNMIQGVGIRPADQQRSVVLITFDGQAEQATLVWRMQQMCDAMIEERYLMAEQVRKAREQEAQKHIQIQQGDTRKPKRRKGAFASSEKRCYTLQEAQEAARTTLLQNVNLDSPLLYNMLNYTITDRIPALIEDITSKKLSPLGLIVLDDLTRVINEGADLIRGLYNGPVAVARSQIGCELSDNLKRLAMMDQKNPSAVMVVNHVIDPQDRHKEAIRTWLESRIDEVTSSTQKSASVDNTQKQPTFKPQPTPKGQDAFLSLPFQELQFAGIMANLGDIRMNKYSKSSKAELIEDFMSDTQMASMGLNWVNGINVRVMLSVSPQKIPLPRHQHFRLADSNLPGKHLFGIRKATVVLNPFAPIQIGPQSSVDYIICPSGVHSLKTLGMDSEESVIEPVNEDREDEENLWKSVGDDYGLNEAEWDAQMVAATQRIEEEHAMRRNTTTDSFVY
ncbi:uncharacterized protein FA14DRAFT_159105 [Meira miltonrushii]|uniref:Rad51-like C-terminal domain-containing protein n=1 Tax=Meira miltonrushii TaxID=1280837 RepID=A0A316VGE2_9BASI|nr:uncharacterized protein FA14DRAFT_159105 [Meira miltonrushii]PWN36699.1 hypothetical protein FA14DRAFT_159105 [Meira miltonrushii]